MDGAGLDYGATLLGGGHNDGGRGFGDRFWRPGDRQTGRVTYDEATGTFRLAYDRTDSTRGFVRTAKADLAYRYQTSAGASIADPRRNRTSVSKVTYSGTREGSETGTPPPPPGVRPADAAARGSIARTYTSRAAWTLDALTTATATFAGQQQSAGSMTLSRPDSAALKTTYSATLTSNGVTVSRRDSLTASPEGRVKGTLTYAVTTTVQRGAGTPVTRTTEGTIDLDGKGGALMRFEGLSGSLYRIDLRDGSRERRSAVGTR